MIAQRWRSCATFWSAASRCIRARRRWWTRRVFRWMRRRRGWSIRYGRCCRTRRARLDYGRWRSEDLPPGRPYQPYCTLMKLIFLHGSPAVGKLTVAKALLRLVPGRLMDNHANVDLARTVFDFGAPGFWELVHSSRCVALHAAGKHGVPLLVTTYCYVEPNDRPAIEEFEAILGQYGGKLLPVFLYCSPEETARRVGNPDRLERGKLTSAEGLIDFIDGRNFTSLPREDCSKFDTETMRPNAVAEEIVRRFALTG